MLSSVFDEKIGMFFKKDTWLEVHVWKYQKIYMSRDNTFISIKTM